MSVTLSLLLGKFKCSLLNVFFCPDGITPNSGLTGPNNTIYIYIYISLYIYGGVCGTVFILYALSRQTLSDECKKLGTQGHKHHHICIY